MASNDEKFQIFYGLLTNKGSEFFSNAARAIMNYPIPWYGFDGKKQPEGARNTTNLAAFVGWIDAGIATLNNGINTVNTGVNELKSTLAGVKAAVEALGKQQGIDPKEMARIVDEAVEKSADKHFGDLDLGTYEFRKVEDTK